MMKFLKNIACFLTLAAMVVIASCKTTKENLQEPIKDLNGTWKLTKLVRNSSDITKYADSSDFRLTLNADNSYSIQNNVPFIVNSGGVWSPDDPQYPFKLTFSPTDSTNAFTVNILTPVSKGERSMIVTGSPGCKSNTYVYTLEKLQ